MKKYGIDDFRTVFTKAQESDFLKGANGRDWSANLDWMIKDANFAKILDGNYDNNDKPKPNAPPAKQAPKNAFNSFEQNQYTDDQYAKFEEMMMARGR